MFVKTVAVSLNSLHWWHGTSEVLHGSPLLMACFHFPMTKAYLYCNFAENTATAHAGNAPSFPGKEQ